MESWGRVIFQARRAAITACAASFLTLVAFLVIRSHQLESPPPYYGVWITIPAVYEESNQVADPTAGEGALSEHSERPTAMLPAFVQIREADTTGASSTQLTSSTHEGSDIPQVPSPEPSGQGFSQSGGVALDGAIPTWVEWPSVAVSGQGSEQLDGPLFAINLESTVQPTEPPPLAMHSGIEGHRLYITLFEKDGRIWHRLRLGFFESEKLARQALADLRSDYPRAWVTRVSPEEVLVFAGTVIYEPPSPLDNPTLLIKASPDSSRQAPDNARSHLSLTIPDEVAGRSVAVGSSERQQSALGTAYQTDSNLARPVVQAVDNFIPESVDTASHGFRFRGSPYRASSSELALLQRWEPKAESLQQGDMRSAIEGQDGLVGYSLALDGQADVDQPGSTRGFGPANQWDQTFALHGELSWSKLVNLDFRNRLTERRDAEGESIGAFLVRRDPDQWQQNSISSSAVDIGVWDDRLTSQTVLNTSRYTDSELDDEYVVGYQLFQMIRLEILRGEDTRLSIFGTYADVDEEYTYLDDDDEKKAKKKYLVYKPGQAAAELGGKFGLGPADITLAQINSWNATDSNGFQKTEYETKLGLDLNRLRDLTGDLLRESFSNMAPDSVYLSYRFGAVDLGSDAKTEDHTTEIGAGADWDWGNGYSYLSYSHSYYDNRQPGLQDYDRTEDAFDLGGGMWEGRWNFDGWLSVSWSEQMGKWREATELSLSGGLSMDYRPDDFADLKISVDYDHYRGDYVADDGVSESGSWVFTSQLDFTKYWVELWGPRPSNLGVVFQLRNDSSLERWGGTADRNSDSQYFIGLTMSVGLRDY